MKIKHITEKRLKVVKASDPLPKLSKPTTGREQPHPYTGMLVGSKTNEKDDQGMYNPSSSDINKLSHQRYLMKQFVRYARDVIQFQSLDDLKKEENLDKVLAHMQNDGIMEQESPGPFFGIKNFEGWMAEKYPALPLGIMSGDPKYDKILAGLKREYGQEKAMRRAEPNKQPTVTPFSSDEKEVMKAKGIQPKTSFESLEESVGEFITEEEFDQLAEKQDACYHKVKSRYKVWPSAYASGALVRCRKVGAKNWGNSKKKKKKKSKK